MGLLGIPDRVCETWFVNNAKRALDLAALTTRRQNAPTTRQRAGVARKVDF